MMVFTIIPSVQHWIKKGYLLMVLWEVRQKGVRWLAGTWCVTCAPGATQNFPEQPDLPLYNYGTLALVPPLIPCCLSP